MDNIPRSEKDGRNRFEPVTEMEILCPNCKKRKTAYRFDFVETNTICKDCFQKIIDENTEGQPGLTPDQEVTAEVIMMIVRLTDRVSALERKVKALETAAQKSLSLQNI